MESSDEIVLQNCCHTLSFLATADHARHDEAMTKLHDLLAALRKRLDELIAQKEEINARADESDSDQMDVDGEETSSENVDHLISVVVRRIATLSKRWPLADLLDERDEDEEEVADKLCDQIFQLVTKELDVRKPITEEEEKLETEAALPEEPRGPARSWLSFSGRRRPRGVGRGRRCRPAWRASRR